FNRVVEQSPAGANASLSRIPWTPRDTDPGCEGLVISLSQSCRNSRISANNQAGWYDTCVVAVRVSNAKTLDVCNAIGRELAGVNGGILCRPECLDTMGDVGKGRVKLASHSVVSSYVRPDLPAV